MSADIPDPRIDELLSDFDLAEEEWKKIEQNSIARDAARVAWPFLRDFVASVIPSALASIPGGPLAQGLVTGAWKFIAAFIDKKLAAPTEGK